MQVNSRASPEAGSVQKKILCFYSLIPLTSLQYKKLKAEKEEREKNYVPRPDKKGKGIY